MQHQDGFLVCPGCGARFLYSDTGPAPKVVPNPGCSKPLLEARKSVYGVSETHFTTGTLYNLPNKMQKHRRRLRRSSENAADIVRKGGLVLRHGIPQPLTRCRGSHSSCTPATGSSTS